MVRLVRNNGSALVAVLLMSALLLVTGMALLSTKSSEYTESVRLSEAAQARRLAESGLIDFQTKLRYSQDFPPPLLEGSSYFVYSETLTRPDGSEIGSYIVKLDRGLEGSHKLWRVTAQGFVGDQETPDSVHTSFGEIDVSPTLREDAEQANPHFMKWVNLELSLPGGGGG
jgi:hypothetical protein